MHFCGQSNNGSSCLGLWGFVGKIDIKSAYRIVPVASVDRPLLGITWWGKYYVDARLPFGLWSAPKILNAVADALEWCYQWEGVSHLDHYLDDFITMGPPASNVCMESLQVIRELSARLGIPLAEEKNEDPSSSITFLSIWISTGMEHYPSCIKSWIESRGSCSHGHKGSGAGDGSWNP